MKTTTNNQIMNTEDELRWKYKVVIERDGGEVDVWNVVSVGQMGEKRFHGFEPHVDTVKKTKPCITTQSGERPEAVTEWVADEIQDEMGIDVRDHGIEVIDSETMLEHHL